MTGVCLAGMLIKSGDDISVRDIQPATEARSPRMAAIASATSAWYSTVLNRATGRLNALLRMNADLLVPAAAACWSNAVEVSSFRNVEL
jgi:hypothetical protein